MFFMLSKIKMCLHIQILILTPPSHLTSVPGTNEAAIAIYTGAQQAEQHTSCSHALLLGNGPRPKGAT